VTRCCAIDLASTLIKIAMNTKDYLIMQQFANVGSLAACYDCGPLSKTTVATKTIAATVVDEYGEVVPGVNVVIAGTATGTMTDIDGRFTLPNVPLNATIDFSYQTNITKIPAAEIGNVVSINTI